MWQREPVDGVVGSCLDLDTLLKVKVSFSSRSFRNLIVYRNVWITSDHLFAAVLSLC